MLKYVNVTDDPYGDLRIDEWDHDTSGIDPYGDLIDEDGIKSAAMNIRDDDEDSPFDDLSIDDDDAPVAQSGAYCENCRYGAPLQARTPGKIWCIEDAYEKSGDRDPRHWCKKYEPEKKSGARVCK